MIVVGDSKESSTEGINGQMQNAKRKTNRQKPKAKSQSPIAKRPKVVYCDLVAPCFFIGYGERRRQPTDWMFEFRANVSADHSRGIEAFTYFATWRIAPNLPGKLAAIVELKDRAMRKGIALLEVFGVWRPQ